MRAIKFFVLFLMFIAVFLPLSLQYLRAPTGTTYALGDGYMPDYYQYLSWIKSGQLGQILLSSRLSAIPQPNALVHPLFALWGMLTGIFHLSTPVSYLLLRAIALIVFFVALYRYMQTIFPSRFHQKIGLLLFLFGTGFETIPWSGHFSIISKYSLPPHHLLALSTWMGLIMVFEKRNIVVSIILGWCLALLNPSIFLFAMIFLAISQIRNTRYYILLAGVSPIILYNLFTLRSTPPWSIMYIRMLAFNPPTTFINYLLSLGPLFPLSIIGVWVLRKNLSLLHTVLISWAYLPIALFPLVGSVLPVNYSRLFQTYQYIPITLLAVSALVYLIRSPLAFTLSKVEGQGVTLKKLLGVILIATLIIYGAIAYAATLRPQLQTRDLSYYNIFIPNSLLAAFRYLDALPNEQVVLSGEYVSGMIPAFTKHRAVIGRDDVIADYYPLRDQVFAFLDGRMTEIEALTFVKEQYIKYVIFGVDTKPLHDLPTKNYRFLVPIFTDGTVSVTLRK